ncbi:MAG: RNA polymerase sigma factor [Methylotenera sp.]|uniref:RNA polymerase sigma factor n=1 Tax=Methylotenera sp. TaxID=2051956 RepID=UPI0017D97362|nr:RNA polymerase sigma factor [Methylotenera sp.]NOU25716.1 RNA polymerase sigma factor [Methylotenera sp.]
MNNTLNWQGIDLNWAYADLLSHITRQTSCVHRARDVLHDAIVCFALSKNEFRHTAPKAYLHGIVSHLLVNDFRYFARHLNDEIIDAQLHKAELSIASAEHLAEIRQRLQLLQRIIDTLPPRCREAFWLFHVEELSQKQIASKLNISVNMVERHIIRAMLDLRAAKHHLI